MQPFAIELFCPGKIAMLFGDPARQMQDACQRAIVVDGTTTGLGLLKMMACQIVEAACIEKGIACLDATDQFELKMVGKSGLQRGENVRHLLIERRVILLMGL